MTLKECYSRAGGDYAEVIGRFGLEKLVAKLLSRFPEDTTFDEVLVAMAGGKRDEAYRAAHSLKGVALNLGLGGLGKAAAALSDLLKAGGGAIPEEAWTLLEKVKEEYANAVAVVKEFSSSL